MADVIGSFTRGVGLGDRMARTWEDKGRREKEDEYLAQRRERQDMLDKRSDEEYESNKAWTLKSRGQTEEQWKRAGELHDLNVENAKKQAEVYDHQLTLANRQEDAALAQNYYQRAIATGNFERTEQEEEAFGRNPHLDVLRLASPELEQGMIDAENLMVNASKGGDIEPNDPQLINAVNQLFPEIVNSSDLPAVNRDGKRITGRNISSVRLYPGQDGQPMFVVEQSIELEDGTTEVVPVTVNRSSDPNDDVRLVSLNELTERMGQLREMKQGLVDDQMHEHAVNYYQLRWGGGPKSGKSEPYDKKAEQYRKQAFEIDKEEAEALESALTLLDADATPEEIKAAEDRVKARFNARRKSLEKRYGKVESANASGDPDKAIRSEVANLKSMYKDYDLPAGLLENIELELSRGESINLAYEFIDEKISSGDIKRKGDAEAKSIMESMKTRGGQPVKSEREIRIENLEKVATNTAIPLVKRIQTIRESELDGDEISRLTNMAQYPSSHALSRANQSLLKGFESNQQPEVDDRTKALIDEYTSRG